MNELLAEVRESIASVLDDRCSSLAVHAFIDGRGELDTELLEIAAELGWLAVSLPEDRGGIGLGAAGLAILNIELGRAAAPGPFLATSVALEVIARSEIAEQDRIASLVSDVMAGSATLALAAAIDPRREGESTWLLGDRTAKAAVVTTDDEDLLLVDLASTEPELVPIWDETRSVISVTLSQVKPIARLPAMRPMLESLYAVAVAADSAGAARGTLDRTVRYLKEREQFGRPIGSFQALKHRAADHKVDVVAAEELVWQAAEQVDGSLPGEGLWTAMAKANASDIAAKVAGDCVQLHGGVGFTREYDPHLFMKRARLNQSLLAANTAMRDIAERAFREALRSGHEVLEFA